MNPEIAYYFNHPHNNTIATERAVELVLSLKYIDSTKGDLIEVGAVTPYYIKSNHACLDPTDPKATIKEFAENYDYSNKNVLSISTIEHIGQGDYGLEKNDLLAFDTLNKIYKESKSCLISWPIGYNKFLDSFTKDNLNKFNYFFYVKRSQDPSWELIDDEKGFDFHYGVPFNNGNSIIFITK